MRKGIGFLTFHILYLEDTNRYSKSNLAGNIHVPSHSIAWHYTALHSIAKGVSHIGPKEEDRQYTRKAQCQE